MVRESDSVNVPPTRRRSMRLPGYDYSQAGAYFVTICTRGRVCVLGDVVDGRVRLSEFGRLAHSVWSELPRHYSHVRLDAWVVMPNHVHGIVMLEPSDDVVGAGLKPAPTIENELPSMVLDASRSRRVDRTVLKPAPVSKDELPSMVLDASRSRRTDGTVLKSAPTGRRQHGLPEVVRAFKTYSARRINAARGATGTPFWQRNYYEHVIRDEESLDRIREYIVYNPARWDEDPENPASHRRR